MDFQYLTADQQQAALVSYLTNLEMQFFQTSIALTITDPADTSYTFYQGQLANLDKQYSDLSASTPSTLITTADSAVSSASASPPTTG